MAVSDDIIAWTWLCGADGKALLIWTIWSWDCGSEDLVERSTQQVLGQTVDITHRKNAESKGWKGLTYFQGSLTIHRAEIIVYSRFSMARYTNRSTRS